MRFVAIIIAAQLAFAAAASADEVTVGQAGKAFNPTDLLNVRKDPTDPTFQRAGAWLARVEAPFESSAFTLLFAPQVTQSAFGIPYGFLAYPEWDKKDDQLHWLDRKSVV